MGPSNGMVLNILLRKSWGSSRIQLVFYDSFRSKSSHCLNGWGCHLKKGKEEEEKNIKSWKVLHVKMWNININMGNLSTGKDEMDQLQLTSLAPANWMEWDIHFYSENHTVCYSEHKNKEGATLLSWSGEKKQSTNQ